jgi:lipopolysaccharide/colanic/teichoic acid biosynthesis glycosyltransferase
MLSTQSTVIVAASVNDFAHIISWSNAAFSGELCIVPIQSEQECLKALINDKKCLLVIDPVYTLDSAQTKIIQRGIALGANWCSLKTYIGHLRGFPDIGNITDLLEWLEQSNYKTESVIFERIKCLGRRLIAAILLTTLSPLLIAIALGIKCTSPGPIIYRQTRVGFRGKAFQLLKFRSMHANAERNGPQWSSGEGDPRTFAFGKFLRKTHLDEFPQLWNIIKGDLCFIGPRPERPEFHELLAQEIPHFDSRTRVKPGITGWAQLISGYASSIEDCKRKIAHDLYFIRNTRRALHLTIILKTIQKISSEVVTTLLRALMSVKSKAN